MNDLSGKRILVVEDEVLVAAMVEDMLLELGAVVVGPAFAIPKAMQLAANETLDGALLDVNVREQTIEPVAAVLRERGIPMVFATGYGKVDLPGAENAPVIGKPYTQDKLRSALMLALKNSFRTVGPDMQATAK